MPKHFKRYKLNKRGKIVAGICAGLILLLFLAVVSLLWKGTLEISLNGEEEMLLRYGVEHYEEAGAKAVYKGFLFTARVNVPVTIEGQPDYGAGPGIYNITYSASRGRQSVQKTRTVTIRDLTAPHIYLLTDPNYQPEAGEPYQEEGYIAYDYYDGDVTADVIVRDGEDGFFYYTVTDKAGNTAEEKREIHYVDTIAPNLFLNGKSEIILNIGDVFEDPGATAMDNADGDLTDKIQVNGTVDTSQEGTRTISYTVSDKAGNTARIHRTIIVRPAGTVITPTEPVSGSVIYLTFDDGPGPYTEELLALLDRYNIKATFFVTNQKPGYSYCIALEAAAGHSIGIHSYSHDYAIYANEETFFADINAMRDIIVEQTGKAPDILRFIGGSSTTKANYNPGIISRLAAMVEQQGYAYFDWNVSTGDGNFAISTQDAYTNAVNGISVRTNSVVLMHDLNKNSMAAVEDIIVWGLTNGYTFLPLTHDSPVCHHHISN
jgi:peptidoglycan/xylan/chitin deacetylase (PgdA/CDA1 family)